MRTATAEMGGKRGMSPTMVVFGAVVAVLLAALLLSAREVEGMEMCNMDAEKLAGCLPAIRGPDPPPPSDSCCAGLRAADLPCFCLYKDSVILRSMGIDPKLAAALPSKCNIAPPPECSGVP